METKTIQILEEAFQRSKTTKSQASEWLGSYWINLKSPQEMSLIRNTGVSKERLQKIGFSITQFPPDFVPHKGIERVMQTRRKMIETGENIDWGMAEHLAFGTLLLEKFHVRVSGQDVERGTFSHRHAVIHDQVSETPKKYVPLNHILPIDLPGIDTDNDGERQAIFIACNSSLSEFGVLGFELGYSLENPQSLIIWEAQFGDFANGAQVIIDQFISSGEAKWMRQSGLVMLLPHGYDGAGPEHSSGRPERFLQMVNEDPDVYPDMDPKTTRQIQAINMQIVNPTTPANFFHLLRRQIHRDFRKPLVVFTPKSLLRHRLCVSQLEEFLEGTRFKQFIPETSKDLRSDEKIRKIVFSSGKVYYDLLQHRESQNIKDVALARIEQLAPFPFDQVGQAVARYPNAEVVWVQEEPKNMGYWAHTQPRIETAIKHHTKNRNVRPKYVGRPVAAAPSTGFSKVHKEELLNLLREAFS